MCLACVDAMSLIVFCEIHCVCYQASVHLMQECVGRHIVKVKNLIPELSKTIFCKDVSVVAGLISGCQCTLMGASICGVQQEGNHQCFLFQN